MGKKQNIDQFKQWVLENSIDIKCVSNYCVDNKIDGKTELLFQCNKNHIFLKTITNFKKNPRCPHCTGKYRHTFEEVKRIIESVEGYLLLSTEYVKSKDYLIIQCDKNHIFPMTFDSFNNGGHRCPICNSGGNYKYNLEIAREIFKVEKCELLATEYINTDIPMAYKCSCGKPSKIALKDFMRGQRCYDCRNKKIGDIKRTPYIEIYNYFKNHNCELLSSEDEIQDNKTIVKYICSCGNQDEVIIQKFKSGERCNNCKQKRFENTSIINFGFKSPLQNPEIRKKIRQSLYKNGTAPCSRQQKYIHNLIGGELNYPSKGSSLDIAFPNKMIYLEYDGGGHKSSVTFGTFTEEEFIKRERNRTYGLLRSGWREIRIISTKDLLPSDQKLLDILTYAQTYFNQNHHYIKFDIDNSKIINSQGEFDYDFGELRKIKSVDLQEVI